MRLDKFIWTVRLSKTRSLAVKACNAEKIKVNNELCKPSKAIKIGDIITFKQTPIWRTYKILQISKSRIGAKLVDDHINELTSAEDLETLQQVNLANRQNKSLGIKGRPTKKDRRNIDEAYNKAND